MIPKINLDEKVEKGIKDVLKTFPEDYKFSKNEVINLMKHWSVGIFIGFKGEIKDKLKERIIFK